MKWAIKGNIVYTKNSKDLTIIKNGYIVCDDNKVVDVFETLPEIYTKIKITDYGNKIILPGLIDLHVHAPQYSFKGTGMDLELLDWLNTYTFVEEAKFNNLDYARTVYEKFVDDLKNSATTRASIFATVHVDATIELMNLLENSGLKTSVGKVNMNMNCPDNLSEGSCKNSKDNTINWLKKVKNSNFINTTPIITPRFVPSCSEDLLTILGDLSTEYKLSNQSHLSENISEINWVKELVPNSKFYGDAYYIHNLFGGDNKTIMAHCVYSSHEEIELMKKQGVYIAHCPTSNSNLSSGIAPAKKYLNEGLNIGLGSDIAAGHSLSIFKAMADAITVSKLRTRLVDNDIKSLKLSEVLFMATKGGGSFFGNVGSFEPGFEMDAIVIDDDKLNYFGHENIENRLESIIYQDYLSDIVAKYVNGTNILDNNSLSSTLYAKSY